MGDGRMMETDVAIVGGGLAGLTAAALLARAGRRVVLFEAGHLGGRAATQERGGYLFNYGPHALYRAGALSRILAELGISVRGSGPAAQGLALRGGQRHLLPRSPETIEQTSLYSSAARQEAGQILTALAGFEPDQLTHVALGEWLDSIEHVEVRQMMAALIRLSTFAGDERQSLGAVAAQLQRGSAGVLYLDDGWASMVAQLERLARDAGVEIRTGTPVGAVIREGGARGVGLQDGTVCAAEAVVLAASPSVAARLTGKGTVLDRWAEGAIPVRLASLDIALRRLPHPERRFALALEEPLYFSVHAPSARLGPAGSAVLHVARYLRSGEETAEGCEAELEALLDQLQPGWRDELVERRFLRQVTVTHALVTAEMGGTAGRPGPAVPGVPGLYVAGDWVGPEGLLADASAASAASAATAILERHAASPTHAYALA